MPTTSEMSVDANTLVLYHCDGTAGSAGKIDNAEGTSSKDLTEVNSPTAVDGVVGTIANGAYNFDGTERCTIGTSVWSGSDTAGTVEGWLYINANPGADTYPFDFGQGGEGIYIMVNSSGQVKARFRYTGGGDKDTDWYSLDTGQWYYLAATCSDPGTGTGRLYVNGSEVKTVSLAGCSGDLENNLNALGALYGGTGPLNCRIDEVRVSNIARTASEISNYYNPTPAMNTWAPIGEYRNLEKTKVAPY